jgi:hypothetical protein
LFGNPSGLLNPLPQPEFRLLIKGEEPRDSFGVGQFAPSNMVAINPVVHDMRADTKVGRHFCDRVFFWALERGDRDGMRKANPPNRRDRQAIAFPGLDTSLNQVCDHLFIIRVLGELAHLLQTVDASEGKNCV